MKIDTNKKSHKSNIFGSIIFILIGWFISILTSISILEIFGIWVLAVVLYIILNNIYLIFTNNDL
jgi:hypothetical protein